MTVPDRATCERIFDAREARYDGRLFVGVKSTGVYCRPVCRVRVPKRSNCSYYGSAAAAQAAGFRPCLRCRPETAPTLATWNGTSTTVERALALIAGGALDDERVGALATRLGIGERHLRRLFAEHLGTTPIAVVQTRRVLFAKKLITDTSLSMTQIALAAGFSSVRRFNEAMSAVYRRPPSELRRARLAKATLPHEAGSGASGAVTLALAYAGPYDWPLMKAWVGWHAIAGVETVREDGGYVRSICYGTEVGTIEVLPVPLASEVNVTIRFPNVRVLFDIVDRIKRIFDLDADLITITEHLGGDPRLAPLVAKRPGLRLPGAWDGYEVAVRSILGQQVSVAAACALAARLVHTFGTPLAPELCRPGVDRVFPPPDHLAECDIAAIGMPRTRAEAVRTVARAAAGDRDFFSPRHDLASSVERLARLPGVGDWTAHYIAMRALREPDAFPAADIGLMRAAADETGRRPNARTLTAIAEPWRPWRAYAALHLWAADAERAQAQRAIA